MLFDDYIWDNVKSYLIDYRKIQTKRKLKLYEDIALLSDSYVVCYCERLIKFSKYHQHLKSKSHQSVNSNVLKSNKDIEIPKLLFFELHQYLV